MILTLTLSLRPDVTVLATIVPEGSFDHGLRCDCFSCVLPDSKPGTYHWLTEAEEYMRKRGGQYEIVGLLRDFKDAEELSVLNVLKAIRKAGGDPEQNWLLIKKIQ